MNNEKSIHACYEEIKQREIRELKSKLKAFGGVAHFGRDYTGKGATDDDMPIVLVDLDGEPFNMRIHAVSIVKIDGEEQIEVLASIKDGDYEFPRTIDINDVMYGHIDFITSAIPEKKKYEWSDETMRLCEAVSELSNLLYGALYLKLQDSFAVDREIIRLAIDFEEGYDEGDFLDEIDKYANGYFKTING